MSTRRLLPLLPLAACSAVCMTLAAQSTGVTTGDIKGLVRDAGGAPINQARVTLADESTGFSRSVNADAGGAFAFRLLTPGTYTMTVEAPGFSTKKISGIGVHLASTQTVPVSMQAVEANATVEIIGQNSIVDPTRTQVSNTIDTNLIANLPINRRDFTSFSLTTPLVAQDNSPTSKGGGAAASSGLSFAGQNARANNVMVDGLDNNDVSVGSTRTTFSQDAIQEFVVVANGFSAEYGRAAGGALNIITKSGGNDFTGDAFFYYRSGKWDAKRPLAPNGMETPFTQRQYGATVSGPLVKDKLFYLVSVERFDKNDVNITNFTTAFASAVQAASGYTLNPGAQTWNENYTTGLIKLDWYASAASHWTLRYNQAHEVNGSQLGWGGLTDITAGGSRDIQDKAFSLANLWTPTAEFVNDFRILGSKRDHDLESLDPNLGPAVVMAGEATFGTQRFLPQVRTEKDYEFFDSATVFAGHHTLKIGADLMRTNVTGTLPLQFAGVYRFQGFRLNATTVFADALQAMQAPNPYGGQGLPVAFIQGFGKEGLDFDANYFSAFLQDTWQMSDRFTLNLGVRLDHEDLPPFHDVADYDALAAGGPAQLSSWSVGALPGSTGATGVAGGPYYASDQFSHSLNWTSTRVSPRLSFNWQMTDQARLYGGYGTFSGRTALGPFGAVYLNNGTDMQTIVQILQADPTDPTAPWKTWANFNGNTNRRYQSNPGGIKSLLLPGHSEMPETKQSNLGFELAPLPTLKFTLDLLYTEGSHFLMVRDVNALVPNPAFGAPGAPPVRRPDARYSSVIRYDDSGESTYRGGTFGVQWQLRDSVALNFSYTYSKTEDNYTDWVTDIEPMNTFDPKTDKGPSNQDQRNRFLLSAVFSSKNWQNAFFRNWTLSFIGRYASGRPYTILTGVDNDYGTLGGQNFGNGDGGAPASDRPVGLGRNSETLPSNSNLDMRLARKFNFGKKGGMEVSLDVFNVFNHYSQTDIQNVLAAPNYGSPVSTALDHNREVQAGVRFSW